MIPVRFHGLFLPEIMVACNDGAGVNAVKIKSAVNVLENRKKKFCCFWKMVGKFIFLLFLEKEWNC